MSNAERNFLTAARKVERLIADLTAGSETEREINASIERLYDRANKPEIRGDETVRDRCYARIDALRTACRDARDAGYRARMAAREAQLRQLKSEEPRLTGYEKELRLMQYGRM